MTGSVDKDILVQNLLWTIFQSKRTELAPGIIFQTKGEVVSGPFRGMKIILQNSTGSDGDVLSKLLGVYEQQLHSTINAFAQKTYDAVVNVGCAEGFYAVGLSRLFPEAITYAFDIDPASQQICGMSARANGVERRVLVGGFCSPAELIRLHSLHKRMLCVVDCEGFELDLLDQPAIANALRQSDVIVECHDFLRHGVTEILSQRFAETHHVKSVASSGRDLSSFAFLRNLSDLERAILSLEMRPCVMNWLVCEAKDYIVN